MKKILCWFGKHDPSSMSSFHEGIGEGVLLRLSRCKRCNKPLIWNPFDNKWWTVDEETVKDMGV